MSGATLPYLGGSDRCKGCSKVINRGEQITFINGRNFYHADYCAEKYEQKEIKKRV
jgi:hypothetical protein